MICAIVQTVEAWDQKLQRYVAANLLECKSRYEITHKTEPENLEYAYIDGRIHWFIVDDYSPQESNPKAEHRSTVRELMNEETKCTQH